MGEFNIGDVCWYQSRFLKKETDPSHFHPIVLDILLGEDGPKKGVVIITTYTKEKEESMKRFGENSYIIIEPAEYEELSRTSMISCQIYEEDECVLRQQEKRGRLKQETLNKIKEAAGNHKLNLKRIKDLL